MIEVFKLCIFRMGIIGGVLFLIVYVFAVSYSIFKDIKNYFNKKNKQKENDTYDEKKDNQ